MQPVNPPPRRTCGRIVNISSICGRMMLPMAGPYAASKFAREAIGDSMRLQLSPHGVSVNSIERAASPFRSGRRLNRACSA
ncbi:MAG: SDR family NAD(P)-dependent oxidoreductase [Phycisphaerales bacterium]|nr:MAG: SDR family NAD(P)-dependent oxidoreductase [Phycisphaerales bacterium]